MVEEASPIEIVDVDSFCFTPISHKGTNRSNAICVEQYIDDRDIDLRASLGNQAETTPGNFIDLSKDNQNVEDDDEVRVLMFKPANTPFGKRRKTFAFGASTSTVEIGQSSNSNSDPSFVCEICVEPKTQNESFSVQGCSHVYCTDCMMKYVASKLQDNITSIRCPVSDCRGLLEPEYCRPILPPEMFDRWGNALCEAVLLESEKLYCPFKDCSALLIDDGGEVIRQSECPNCRRLFCAQCKVPWHTGMDCVEFQELNKDERENEDIMLMNLAKNKKWRRCPMCRFYVEKSQGCMYMKCRLTQTRCGIAFCYNCGAQSQNQSHYCYKCRR
ncbi:RBR-type E3 ubiquitin transferase [Quillaja saponaria]|uniref:RBR-type E3 ubiquitin transferase n=1 Tax=Quillaja saponaria TaxID=32244 RepID=A0AAD7LDN2_QUISA|nr:RBR-type E3 ubiquitin transferase [Quillaja saponaria]